MARIPGIATWGRSAITAKAKPASTRVYNVSSPSQKQIWSVLRPVMI